MKPSSSFPPIRLALLFNNIIFLFSTIFFSHHRCRITRFGSIGTGIGKSTRTFPQSFPEIPVLHRQGNMSHSLEDCLHKKKFPDQYVRDNSHLCFAV
ncbi:hypothetical protein CEXT_626761 [Caerostris extrusa]|uniref:Uncharacterized protein n=1 Tax=Caerostris extrusa TaxID=172846 RepID=A0AAV4NEK4_CAEEX|nr:hypothetical protein CEXT_626761 [Caerostris extrusa]